MSDEKPRNPAREPKKIGSRPWRAGQLRVRRGGYWNIGPDYLESASRYDNTAGYRFFNFGFRIARTKK